jgi:hypothetical protein
MLAVAPRIRPDLAHPTLREGVRLRCSRRNLQHLDLRGGDYRVEGGSEIGIPIPDEEPEVNGALVEVHQQVPGGLGDPAAGGVSGDFRPGAPCDAPPRSRRTRTAGSGRSSPRSGNHTPTFPQDPLHVLAAAGRDRTKVGSADSWVPCRSVEVASSSTAGHWIEPGRSFPSRGVENSEHPVHHTRLVNVLGAAAWSPQDRTAGLNGYGRVILVVGRALGRPPLPAGWSGRPIWC